MVHEEAGDYIFVDDQAEYVVATHAAKEAIWLRSLIGELYGDVQGLTTLYSDNQSAIALTKDHQYHA